MNETAPADAPPRGPLLWVLLALPLVTQFTIVAAAAVLLAAITVRPERSAAFYDLPNALVYLLGFLILGTVTVLVARRLGRPRDVLALRRTALLPAIGWSVVAMASALVIARLLEPIFGGSASQDLRQDAFPGGTEASVAIALIGIAFILGAPITEELYFRALLLDPFAAALGRAAAVIATAGLFGLAHFQPQAFPVIMAIGVILAILRFKTRSVWPSIAVHGVNNALAFSIALFGPLTGPS
jgi:membrane protease YdiL (CAAX protease family)